MKKVVILGAGFAGVRCALDLAKSCGESVEVTLVDKNNYHLFPADLYEVATSFSKKIEGKCLVQLKETIATPIAKILRGSAVKFVHDEVEAVMAEKKRVGLKKHGSLDYDYLVVALGSVVNNYGIKGVDEFSFPFKKLKDGLRINCAMDQFFYDLHQRDEKREVFFTVCGGGATGVETAAELMVSLKGLCRKYRFPFGKVVVQLVEGGETIGGFRARGSEIALGRLRDLGVKVCLRTKILELRADRVLVKDEVGVEGELMSDLTIWTAGVKVNDVVSRDLGDSERRGAILVIQSLQSEKWPEVFAAGDNAFLLDQNDKPYPWVAQVAIEEGRKVARNLRSLIDGKEMKEFDFHGWHYVLPVGGGFGVWQTPKFVLFGMWIWLIRRLVFFRYALSILPFWQAVKKAWHSHRVFTDL